MKKLLALAAVVAAIAVAPVAHANEAAVKAEATAPVAKHAMIKLTKEETVACHKEASAVKDGKAPSKEEVKTAYEACVKAKEAAVAPKAEEHAK